MSSWSTLHFTCWKVHLLVFLFSLRSRPPALTVQDFARPNFYLYSTYRRLSLCPNSRPRVRRHQRGWGQDPEIKHCWNGATLPELCTPLFLRWRLFLYSLYLPTLPLPSMSFFYSERPFLFIYFVDLSCNMSKLRRSNRSAPHFGSAFPQSTASLQLDCSWSMSDSRQMNRRNMSVTPDKWIDVVSSLQVILARRNFGTDESSDVYSFGMVFWSMVRIDEFIYFPMSLSQCHCPNINVPILVSRC